MTSIRKLKKKLKKVFHFWLGKDSELINNIVRELRFSRKLKLVPTMFNRYKLIKKNINGVNKFLFDL